MISRRRLIASSAAAAGLGPVLAGTARAATGIEQRWSTESVAGIFYLAQEEELDRSAETGLFASTLDPVVSLKPSPLSFATLIESRITPAKIFYDFPTDLFDDLRIEQPDFFGALRSLGGCGSVGGYSVSSAGERSMMGVVDLANAGGPGGVVKVTVAETSVQYQASLNRAVRDDLEPVWVQVDNIEGGPRFHTLYRERIDVWEARHGVRSEDLTALTAAGSAKGFRVARLAPYYDGGALRFAVLLRSAGNLAWQSRIGLKSPDALDADFRAKGYSLLQATRYMAGSQPLWACLWQNQTGVKPNLFWGV